MGVLAEIAKRVLRTAERAFRVNHPWGAEQRTKPGRERLGIVQCGECSVEAEFVLRMQLFESIHELAPEDFTQNAHRQEEFLLRVDPLRVVRSQTAGGNNTMNMRMVLEFLVPGVEDAEESDLRAETPRIAGDLKQRLGAGPKQQGIDLAFIDQRQWRKLPRQRKDDVDVARGQEFFSPRLEPAVASVSLALRAMPVPARVEGDGLMSAFGTLIQMSAERGRAATQNRVQNFQMEPAEPLLTALKEALSHCAYNIGHLDRWARHLRRVGLAAAGGKHWQGIQRAGGSAEVPLRHVDINSGLLQIAVAEQNLDSAQVGAGL